MTTTTHHTLIAGLREEAPGAWERFHQVYRPWLLAWTVRHLHFQTEDAEDVVQQVMADLHREFREQRAGTRAPFLHNGRPGAFRSWLRGVTHHRALAFLRTRRLRQPVANGEEVLAQLCDPHSALSDLWNREHERQAIHQAWDAIKTEFVPAVWEPIGEILFKDRRAREIADEFHVPLRTLYGHLRAVKERMKQMLDGLLEE